jgi:hypothetical protein
MTGKFQQFDVVRRTGSLENLIVAAVEPDGLRYMLKDQTGCHEIGWANEDELELVKKAYADVTGFGYYSH